MKKVLLLGLSLTLVVALAACSRQSAPDVTPTPSEVPTATPIPEEPDSTNGVVGENTPVDENGDTMMDDLDGAVGDIVDDAGEALDDAARGVGDAARKIL